MAVVQIGECFGSVGTHRDKEPLTSNQVKRIPDVTTQCTVASKATNVSDLLIPDQNDVVHYFGVLKLNARS
ncbi:hypothetical protein D3C72_2401770 [compost metagenome]